MSLHKGLRFTGSFMLWDEKAPAKFYSPHYLYPECEIKSIFDIQQKNYCEVIKKLIDNSPTVSGQELMDEIFPEISADIFISHAHADVNLAKDLAFYLLKTCKCRVFIDEYAWGNAYDILKYVNEGEKMDNGNYSYDGCNKNAAAIYMILANAISSMIHKCKLFIFIESENSLIKTRETASPWLFYELQLFNKIVENECKIAKDFDISIPPWLKLRNFTKYAAEGMKISYPAPQKFLLEANKRTIYDWSYSQYPKTPEGLHMYHTSKEPRRQ